MALSDLQEAIKKHGKSGRYVFLLEQELRNRRTRRRTLLASLALNVLLLFSILLILVTH